MQHEQHLLMSWQFREKCEERNEGKGRTSRDGCVVPGQGPTPVMGITDAENAHRALTLASTLAGIRRLLLKSVKGHSGNRHLRSLTFCKSFCRCIVVCSATLQSTHA